MSPPPTSDDDVTLLRELVYLFGQVRKRSAGVFKAELAAKGESWLLWVLLATLSTDGPCSQRDISEATAMDPSVISRLLEEAEDEHLVKRHRDPDDRRKAVVELLEAGRHRFEKHLESVLPLFDRVLSPLTHDERLTLLGLYRKLAQSAPTGESAAATTGAHPAAPTQGNRTRVRTRG